MSEENTRITIKDRLEKLFSDKEELNSMTDTLKSYPNSGNDLIELGNYINDLLVQTGDK